MRINLWTGLFALGMGLCFVAWALLRPLRMEEIAEAGVADDEDDEPGDERRGRAAAGPSSATLTRW